ncbi:MAG: 6-phosphofructokinase [Eubacterium sp.]
MNKNCIVAQSGGPTCAINASLAGIISEVLTSDKFEKVYGSINGITGILNNNIMDLSEQIATVPDFIDTLKVSPAMYLGSCRFKLPPYSEDSTPYEKIFDIFNKLNIGAFFYIGGNDSMDTVMKLGEYAKSIGSSVLVIGIPKTIDNDLYATDHTPGYGSAAKYIASSMLEIAHDISIYDIKSVTIVEIMGRDAGWLTAAAALARNEYSRIPHLIYLPETAFDKDSFIRDVKDMVNKVGNVVVAVSEGIRDKDGVYIAAGTATEDKFGHKQLSGAGKCLEYMVKNELGIKARSVEINILQRCAAHMSSLTDLNESFDAGKAAVKYALEGFTECMITINRESDTPYSVNYSCSAIKDIANYAKSVPLEWISHDGNDVTDEFINYMLPLIQGEIQLKYKNGIPSYLPIGHLFK